jgi:sialic acid synthase
MRRRWKVDLLFSDINKFKGGMEMVKVIAEIGCNHKGEMEIAKEMIKMAAIFCKADVVKFQKRNNKELLTPEQYNAPHPNPSNSYGNTYGEHREYLEFTVDQHRELKEYCDEFNIEYSTSVWDLASAMEIASLKPGLIKIPSAVNNNFQMLGWLSDSYEGEVHVSVGMTSKDEIDNLVNFFIDKKRNKDVVLYSCTSGYPVPFKDICLLEISKLKQKYGNVVKAIGFSGHHLGIAVDVAAFTLGATWIERHFTLDRTWKGTDHAASLEPDGFRRIVRDLKATEKALTYKQKDILDIEAVQRDKLKYRGC